MASHIVPELQPQGPLYVVTHGKKHNGADPGMTHEGFEQIKSLIALVPVGVSVFCGTGKRHLDVAKALCLENQITAFSSVVGRPDSLEGGNVILASGYEVRFDEYDERGIKEASLMLLNSILPNTILCAGRPFLMYIGVPDVESAAVYRIDPDGSVTKISE